MSDGAMLDIDGSFGEGGGQILRSALALSIATQTPFRLTGIRAGRSRPGLLRQHLTCVKAAAIVSSAVIRGADLGSKELIFEPTLPLEALVRGVHHLSIGSAGSTTLVLQTVLAPMLFGAGGSLRVTGGTHNKAAPPFPFLEQVFLPRLCEMGANVTATLTRAGFYPAGGGDLAVAIDGRATLRPLELMERPAGAVARGVVLSANLPPGVAYREQKALASLLKIQLRDIEVRDVASDGPGNVVMVEVAWEGGRELFTAFGERGVRAEEVAEGAAREAHQFLASHAPVGEHLADQLLVPMALGAGGRFRASVKSSHLETNAWLINRFLGDDAVTLTAEAEGTVVVQVR